MLTVFFFPNDKKYRFVEQKALLNFACVQDSEAGAIKTNYPKEKRLCAVFEARIPALVQDER